MRITKKMIKETMDDLGDTPEMCLGNLISNGCEYQKAGLGSGCILKQYFVSRFESNLISVGKISMSISYHNNFVKVKIFELTESLKKVVEWNDNFVPDNVYKKMQKNSFIRG